MPALVMCKNLSLWDKLHFLCLRNIYLVLCSYLRGFLSHIRSCDPVALFVIQLQHYHVMTVSQSAGGRIRLIK